MKTILQVLITAGAVLLVAHWLDAIVVDGFATAVLVALVLAIINVTIKPIVSLLTLPVTILTLGLFKLIINGAMFYLASALVPSFDIATFGWAIVAALLVSFISSIGDALVGAD